MSSPQMVENQLLFGDTSRSLTSTGYLQDIGCLSKTECSDPIASASDTQVKADLVQQENETGDLRILLPAKLCAQIDYSNPPEEILKKEQDAEDARLVEQMKRKKLLEDLAERQRLAEQEEFIRLLEQIKMVSDTVSDTAPTTAEDSSDSSSQGSPGVQSSDGQDTSKPAGSRPVIVSPAAARYLEVDSMEQEDKATEDPPEAGEAPPQGLETEASAQVRQLGHYKIPRRLSQQAERSPLTGSPVVPEGRKAQLPKITASPGKKANLPRLGGKKLAMTEPALC
mmetsp:Transcript_26964/g.42121  ORF Transcript_26964/g.42121 Transcript_26964/m.42121 type:complete len:283 (-) Transcript_26964:426-1274(-)|eukprot:CAMPEP_0184312350 /NCGR_PEP_ID=MMETSP1049-20130417/49384_1 /TAXON_ID=77928 /ORGANISM="Proteomonas sulcata, Strain CCMP704" /LENGTH=282 /DNA_ID=CAMNT_0026628437 /DNA_START=668 /DNA_END=1516 /DNA_ORIENTATION=+